MIKNAILLFLCLVLVGIATSQKAYAASQDACAIWLCLPGGFPQGCSGAFNEFKHRIKKGKPPLPALSSCTVDGKTNGHYQLGIEPFEPCKQGYTLKTIHQGYGRENQTGICYANSCVTRIYTPIMNDYRCVNYIAIPRPKPSFVKMWVDGKYLGQFFY